MKSYWLTTRVTKKAASKMIAINVCWSNISTLKMNQSGK